MPKNSKHEEEIHRLMSFLAESVAQMSDDQVKEEFGLKPDKRMEDVLKSTLKKLSQQKLRDARAEHQAALQQLSSRSYELPQSAVEQRSLLTAILARQPDLRSITFTAQHRDLKSLTDSDVESFLKQLAELGLLDTFLNGK